MLSDKIHQMSHTGIIHENMYDYTWQDATLCVQMPWPMQFLGKNLLYRMQIRNAVSHFWN